MGIFRTIDNFLLDRVFGPALAYVRDRFNLSVATMAGEVLTVGVLCTIGGFVHDFIYDDALVMPIVFTGLWLWLYYTSRRSIAQFAEAPEVVSSLLRHGQFFWRMLGIFLLGIEWLYYFTFENETLLNPIGWMFIISTWYMIACTPPPPKPRDERKPQLARAKS